MSCAFCDRQDTTDFFIPKTDDPKSEGTVLLLCPVHQTMLYRVLSIAVVVKPCPQCKGEGVIVTQASGNFVGKRVCSYCNGSRIDPRI